MKNLVIFDVCNTVVDTNSTYSYIDYLIKNWVKPRYRFFFHNYFIKKVINWIGLLLNIFWNNIHVNLIKYYFKWLNKNQIEELSIPYFEWYKSKIFKSMDDIIKTQKNNNKIILLSASINPPIDYLKSIYWIEWFSSILEVKDWFYTWRINMPLWWEKEKIFSKKIFNLDKYEKTELYTDNFDDTSLIKFLDTNSKLTIVHIVLTSGNWKNYRNKFFNSYKIEHEFIH